MKFGYFDDTRREYVITSPQAPYPWINYLGNHDFFSLISNTAEGYSFYKDAKLRRITRFCQLRNISRKPGTGVSLTLRCRLTMMEIIRPHYSSI